MPAPWSGGARLRIVGEMHGTETVNVMHFATNTQINDPVDWDALLLALAQAMLACIRDTLLAAVTSDWKLKYVEVTRIAPTVSDPVQLPGIGTDVGQLSPASVSFIASLLSIRTGGGGRSGRGRAFLPPPGEAQVANSDIDGPTLALLAAFVACVVGKFVGSGATEDWRFGVLSRKLLANSPANFDAAFREAVTVGAQATCASLRSRKKGVGS